MNNETIQNTPEYDINLNKALEIAFEGQLQQGEVGNLSATSLQSGGLQGVMRLGVKAKIIVPDSTNDRVLIGDIT